MSHSFFRLILIPIFIVLFVSMSYAQNYQDANPRIQEMVDSVTKPQIRALVEKICAWDNRYSTGTDCDEATKWAQSLFLEAGFDSVYMDKYNTSDAPNVIAVLKGEDNTDTAYAIAGHIDAVSNSQGTYITPELLVAVSMILSVFTLPSTLPSTISSEPSSQHADFTSLGSTDPWVVFSGCLTLSVSWEPTGSCLMLSAS